LFLLQLFLAIRFDLVPPLFFFIDETSTLLQDIFFSLANYLFSGLVVFLSGMKFVDNFLVEPRSELGV
jgi:hypothetical protein